MLSALLVLGGLALLGWTFFQARRQGRVGVLSWLQSVVLFSPWLFFLVLVTFGVLPNPVLLVALLVTTTVGYLWVGNRLRDAVRERDQQLREQQLQRLQAASQNGEPIVFEPLTPRPAIPEDDLQSIRGIFGIDTFFATETQSLPQGVLFKGNLRGESSLVFQALNSRLQDLFKDRYRLFLLADEDQKPTVLVVPSSEDPFQPGRVGWPVALLLLVATTVSLVALAAGMLEFDPLSRPDRLGEALVVAAGVLFTLGLHEAGHRWQAGRWGVRLSPGFLVPLFSPLPLAPFGFGLWPGSFGAITRFESPPPSRRALFDIALAGPLFGGLASLSFLLVGLGLSTTATEPGSYVGRLGDLSQISLLMSVLLKLRFWQLPGEQLILLNPLTFIGILGLTIHALCLLPSGQLDGGRIVQAVYGRRTARITGLVTVVVLAVAGLLAPQPFLFWAAVLFLVGRIPERPTLDELTETDPARDIAAIVALFAMAAVLLPPLSLGG